MQIQEKHNLLNLLICPAVDKIILKNPIIFFDFTQKSSFLNQIANKKWVDLSLYTRCQKLINHILKQREALFYTTYLDRASIHQSLDKLYLHIKTLNENQYAIFDLNHLGSQIKHLRDTIKACESIKIKHIEVITGLQVLPLDVQKIILTILPHNYYINFNFYHSNIIPKLKKLYTLHEPLLYKEILPLLINKGYVTYDYGEEFNEFAPYLNSHVLKPSYLMSLNIERIPFATQSLVITSLLKDEDDPTQKMVSKFFNDINAFPKLKRLEIDFSIGLNQSVKNLTNLHTLSLDITDTYGIKNLGFLTNLETLRIGYFGDSDLDMDSITFQMEQMFKLKKVYLEIDPYEKLTFSDLSCCLESLTGLTRLENLNIYFRRESINLDHFFEKFQKTKVDILNNKFINKRQQVERLSLNNFDRAIEFLRVSNRRF